MADLLVTIAVCIALTIIGLIAVSVARSAGECDAEVEREHELSNAEVTAILKRGK